MTRPRRLMVHAIVALLIGGSLVDTALGREHWPFSDYPMFSRVQRAWTLTTWRPYGVTEHGEVPLLEFAQTLSDCWRRYEARRQRSDHSGPALLGIRGYRVTWQLDPWARNIDRPDRMELFGEVTRPPR